MHLIEKLSAELIFLEEHDVLKSEIDSFRPFEKDIENRVIQKLRLDWNYNSNAIEGNSFSRGETVALLMEGITAKGKPLKDALDIKGHNQAIDFMLSMVNDDRDLNETDIRNLHKLILGENYESKVKTIDGTITKKIIKVGQYKSTPNHVITTTGETHYYATPEETPAKMGELLSWYNTIVESGNFNPLVLASLFHHKFVEIHPFDDGNGRMTRILTNFILIKYGYPISVIKQEDRNEYYAALARADNGEVIPIIEIIADTVKHSLLIYLRAIRGEDISEPDDIDKEIALFRKEIGVKTKIIKKRKDVDVKKITYEIFNFLKNKLDSFSDLFLGSTSNIKGDNPRAGISFTKEMDFSFSEFSKKIKIHNIHLSNFSSFEHIFRNDIYDNGISFNIRLSINFKYENYIISYQENNIIKYYDEKILDKELLKLISIIMKNTMKELEQLKK